MGLDASLGIATQSLANISLGFAVISNNISNADTPGYQLEQATQVSVDGNGLPFGAESGPTQLATDQALQAELYNQNAAASAGTTTSNALSNVQNVLGTVGEGNDLGSTLAALQNSFSALLNDPSSATQQQAVVNAAQTTTQQINALSQTYSLTQQSAQNALVTEVGTLNTALAQVGTLSNQIIAIKAQGGSTADLENQRNQALSQISGLVGAQFAETPDGGMTIITTGGVELPTTGGQPLTLAQATTGSGTYYPGGGLPGIMLGSTDVTGNMTGGAIGANLTLRDQTMPTYQAELDEFSETLATRFSAQGLNLFTDPQGNIPTGGGTPTQSGYIGFASDITVNPTVVATPSLVRDGTQAVTGSATGATAFTPNPDNLSGFSDLINRVLNYSLGADVQSGVTQPAPNTTGLGASGTLSAPFSAPDTLADFATDITASQAADGSTATTTSQDALAAQTTLTSNLQSETGVDMDSQLSLMIQLQNAYGANAKIITAVQSMYNDLLSAVS